MKTLEKSLKSLRRHRNALFYRFAKHLENIFSLSFGAELSLVTIVMSITLFQVSIYVFKEILAFFLQIFHLRVVKAGNHRPLHL